MEVPEWFVEPSIGRRFGGRFLDGLVLLPLLALGLVVEGLAYLLLVALVAGVYEITFVARDGQTLGKRWVGLRVVDGRTGEVPTLNQAALRWVVPQVASLAPGPLASLVFLAVYLPVLKGPLHRGLHDHAAGTVVTACRR